MGEIGLPALLIVLALVLVLLGPGRLAGAGRALGRRIHGFRASVRDGSPDE
ncbi:MAG: twin-arginine translocase TatA/TatE family subunit [Chloroflexaceae bacterium]|nr:twin-arginine translocase TatA/TatE family subunit [Chloroflexaceae bacterium]